MMRQGFFKARLFQRPHGGFSMYASPILFLCSPDFFGLIYFFNFHRFFNMCVLKAIHFALSCGDDNIAHGICFGLMVDGFTTHISWCPDDPDAGTGQKSVDLGSSE